MQKGNDRFNQQIWLLIVWMNFTPICVAFWTWILLHVVLSNSSLIWVVSKFHIMELIIWYKFNDFNFFFHQYTDYVSDSSEAKRASLVKPTKKGDVM